MATIRKLRGRWRLNRNDATDCRVAVGQRPDDFGSGLLNSFFTHPST